MPKEIAVDDNIEFEIKFFESLLEKSPDFVEALSVLGDLYTLKGMYQEGLLIDLRLHALRPDNSIVLYNLACSYSLLNDRDKAFWHIKKALNRGYNDLVHLEQDHDLVNLRDDIRFKRYWARFKRRIAMEP